MTFKGAVVGWEPTAAGPRGLARWRKESASTMILGQTVSLLALGLHLCDWNRLLDSKFVEFYSAREQRIIE